MGRTVEDHANEFAKTYRIELVDCDQILNSNNGHVIGQEIQMRFRLQPHQYNNLDNKLNALNDVKYQLEENNIVNFTSYSTAPIELLLSQITII